MNNTKLDIVFKASWNNLVDLPAGLATLLYNANVSPQEIIVEVVLPNKVRQYLGWSGMTTIGARSLHIDPTAASGLGIKNSDTVVVNIKMKNERATQILLEPQDSSDWELVELHANHIESKLIEQTRCLALNQTLVVFPTKTSSVKLTVTSMGSVASAYALIDPFAEVAISPKLKEKKTTNRTLKKPSKSIRSQTDTSARNSAIMKRGILLPNSGFTRFHDEQSSAHGRNGFYVIANLDEFASNFTQDTFVSVSILTGPSTSSSRLLRETLADIKHDTLRETRKVVARLVNCPSAPEGNVGLSKSLASSLNVDQKNGYKVVLRSAQKCLPKRPSVLLVHPYSSQPKSNEELNLNTASSKTGREIPGPLSDFLSKELFLSNSPILNHMKLPVIPGCLPHGGILEFKRIDDNLAWCKPYESSKKVPRIEFGDEVLKPENVHDIPCIFEMEPLYGLQSHFTLMTEWITTASKTGVLIHGSSGSGKSLLMKWMSLLLADDHGYFVKYVECERVMNENLDSLSSLFTTWANEVVWNEPLILLLDNFDKILPKGAENTDSLASDQLTELFVNLMQSIGLKAHINVSLIASAKSKESFNQSFMQSHIMEHNIHLKAPDKVTRFTILNSYLIKALGCEVGFDLMDIVLETEGYLPSDLKSLSDRLQLEALRQQSLGEPISSGKQFVTTEMFKNALKNFTPSGLRGVKLENSSTNWSEIGGLLEAKKILLETLEWPTRYAPIFSNCPLRLRSGILLYGYPGCGKTLLASAIAAQCGLNFISIKGPEILNKYIGASEQSVRELFERAQAAKPCILFFDEFDSIAPKRGHDSTGVTDRVVNQMLTQMDGAEGLDGVYVLAATSRPDLIDSALLRPGRLDKSVICDMPNCADRLDILRCVSSSMSLESDVTLEEIAEETDGFSGADLQGLGYNAYLLAVHDTLDREPVQEDSIRTGQEVKYFMINARSQTRAKSLSADRAVLQQEIERILPQTKLPNLSRQDTSSHKQIVLVGHRHFMKSLRETKASISLSERRKLDRIYLEFLTGRDGNMPDGSASNDIGGRTTLM